jgi:hypothetical protein
MADEQEYLLASVARRMSKDYETLTESIGAVIDWAMTHLMLRRPKPAA